MDIRSEIEAARSKDYDLVLRDRRAEPSGVRLTPDGSVVIGHLIPQHSSHDCPPIVLDGASARTLLGWLRENLA